MLLGKTQMKAKQFKEATESFEQALHLYVSKIKKTKLSELQDIRAVKTQAACSSFQHCVNIDDSYETVRMCSMLQYERVTHLIFRIMLIQSFHSLCSMKGHPRLLSSLGHMGIYSYIGFLVGCFGLN